MSFCDAFGIPLLTLVDTPGFYPGKDLEWRGMIRHGAQLAFAYARATVPRVAVVLRKAYGGAYIVMDCRTMGSDLYLAWPSAEIAVMGAKGAVEILHRRKTPEERLALEADYEERFLNPYVAADRGLVDAVIDPADTRREVAAAIESPVHQARVAHQPQARQHARCNVSSGDVAESITITDNRTGESIEVPILDGGVDAAEWRKLLPGVWFYDPALMTTASTSSAITELDGENGILRYRGYPIEQLAEQSSYLEVAYLLIHGELPTADQFEVVAARHHVPHVHPRERAQALPRGLPLRRPPDGDARVGDRRAVHLLPRRRRHPGPGQPLQADRAAHRQAAHAGGRVPPLLGGDAVRVPRQLARVLRELPVDDVEGRRASLRRQPRPRPTRSTCCSSSTPTTSRTAAPPRCARWARPTPTRTCAPRRPPPPSTARATAAPTRTSSTCSPRSARIDQIPTFIESVKFGKRRMPGFGHRVYKSYDPRAAIIKKTADEVFAVTGKNPLLDIALALEEVALSDDYFISRKLYPNVDFYSGLIYQAMGFPIEMFTVLFAIPRTAGWLAHWVELLEQDQRIARPRQLYTGTAVRDYVAHRPAVAARRARGHDRRRRARVAGAP